jgi:hypothetical protein
LLRSRGVGLPCREPFSIGGAEKWLAAGSAVEPSASADVRDCSAGGEPGVSRAVRAAAINGKDAMRGYKDQKLDERLARAAEARQKALEKFKARPGPDDPAVVARAAERKAIADAREEREKARAEVKAKEAAERAEREAKEKVERDAREKREAIEKVIRDAAEAAERKAERDRRYAARKARQAKR